MHIGLLGATGPAGKALAVRLAAVGHRVTLGSRSYYRALETRDALVEAWPDHTLDLHPGDNDGAATADMVVIATPWDAATATAVSVAGQLAGKVVICMSNALSRVDREFVPLVPPRGSVANSVQAEVRDAYVAAAFHHVPARELGDIGHDIHSDVLVCSDHPHATEVVSGVVAGIPHMRPLDAGTLSNATAIEAFTAVLLQLNTRYKTRVVLRLAGIDDDAVLARPGGSDPAATESEG